MAFFDLPDDAEAQGSGAAELDAAAGAWEPPRDRLAGPVAFSAVVGRSPRGVVAVQHLSAVPEGFEFDVVAYSRVRAEWDPMYGLAGVRRRPGEDARGLGPEHLRFGVLFSDGRRATNLGPPMATPEGAHRGIWMRSFSGEADQERARARYWVSPLPPPGPVTFVCEWPVYDVPESRVEIDGALLHEAASRAVDVWDDDGS